MKTYDLSVLIDKDDNLILPPVEKPFTIIPDTHTGELFIKGRMVRNPGGDYEPVLIPISRSALAALIHRSKVPPEQGVSGHLSHRGRSC